MRKTLSVLAALAIAASPLAAQAHPDFSGKWALDPASAQTMQLPAGSSITITVKQDDKTINVDFAMASPMGDQKRATVINLDGSPSKNSMATPGGNLDLTSTLAWEGPVAVVTTKGDAQGQSIVQTERWSLDADGKKMNYDVAVAAGGMNQAFKMTFLKQ